MKVYKYTDSPLEVHGLPFWEENHLLQRMKDEDLVKFDREGSDMPFLGKRAAGARICFRTNSTKLVVRFKFSTMSVDKGMSIFACQACNVMIGDRKTARFAGFVAPENYETLEAKKAFNKSDNMEEVTIYLPRNEHMADFAVEIEDDAAIEAPTPYRYGPVLFYGSSITEGGCCTRVVNAYNAILSAELNMDFYNFGFSGNAKGEPEMADIINEIPMSVFVYDYDHNAKYSADLERTHEPFFQRIRQRHPELPIIILSRPDCYDKNDGRTAIIRRTYENAIAAGDKNVWFIDGYTLFPDELMYRCTVDGCHPNDLGFHFMAQSIKPVMLEALQRNYQWT